MLPVSPLHTSVALLAVLAGGLEIDRATWAGAGSDPAGPLVARVNQQPIHADEIRFFLPGDARQQPLAQLSRDLRQAAVRLAVDRRLVRSALARGKWSASDQDIQFELDQLSKQLARRDSSLQEYLDTQQISLASYRQVIGWQLTWRRYLKEAVTDANLERYFQRHRREFDGTQLRVAHIFWNLPSVDSPAERKKVLAVAERVHEEISEGRIRFADAAEKYSEAPTTSTGGEIGWIARRAPMAPQFSRAAFDLKLHEVSGPVVTSMGLHLIRCLEVRPGKKTWQESRPELVAAVHRYLFQWLADRERGDAEIEQLDE